MGNVLDRITIPITIRKWSDISRTDYCPSFTQQKFFVTTTYQSSQSVGDILATAIEKLNKKCDPQKFDVADIHPTTSLEEPITNFRKGDLETDGFQIRVCLMKYNHKIINNEITCKFMQNQKINAEVQCPIYGKMKKQYEYSEEHLTHLNEYSHFHDEFSQKPECKYNEKCYAFIRLANGGNRVDDRCHIKLYRHPPRRRNIELCENLHQFILNKNQDENRDTFIPSDRYIINNNANVLKELIKEVKSNGFESDLFISDEDHKNGDYSLLQVVDKKINCRRHRMMGSPLNKAEMLALVMYTGCDCNYDLCKSQRNGVYEKWKWFDKCLWNAIYKLSLHETGKYCLYSGLSNVKLNKREISSGYFVTYVSATWVKDVAVSFMEDEGMIIQLDESFRSSYHVNCCDVSWISKFPDECEVLIGRSAGDRYTNRFKGTVLDEANGIQTVLLKNHDESDDDTDNVI
eukprot:465754_1